MEPTRVFIHGLESTGQGTKGVYFRAHYPDMLIEDFSGPFAARMEKLERLLAGKQELIIVGSSYGGLMAAVYACIHPDRVRKLILLAPALHLAPFEPYRQQVLPIPVAIFHGSRDDLVPLAAIRMIAATVFPNHTLTVMDDDHPLHDTFASLDWDTLLSLP